MTVFAALPTWAIGLLALGAGAMLLFFNYGWLLAARAMLKMRRPRARSTADTRGSARDGLA
jgi:hypothetical protein